MAPYVSELDGVLHLVRAGDEAFVELDTRGTTVTITDDDPEWVERVARDHGYDIIESPTDARPSTPESPAVQATE